jgi:hypothetical protein
MAAVATVDFYCGDVITIIASNKPYTDMTVQSQVNDYRWADSAKIQIFNENGVMVVDGDMCPIADKVGWYSYRYKTNCDCGGIGIFKTEITMTTVVDDCYSISTTGASASPATSGTSGSPATSGTSGSPATSGTSGTSGSPGYTDCSDVAVYYFRVNPRR